MERGRSRTEFNEACSSEPRARRGKVTHVIWPETATQFLLTDDDFARAMVTSALTPGSILLAGSLRREVNEQEKPAVKMFNSIVALNDLGVFWAVMINRIWCRSANMFLCRKCFRLSAS